MTFQSGKSGNPNGRPRGAISKRSQLAKLLEPYAEELVKKAVDVAMEGDVNALRLCIERLIPKVGRESIGLEIPENLNLESVLKVKADLLQSIIDGKISVGDAERLMALLEKHESDAFWCGKL